MCKYTIISSWLNVDVIFYISLIVITSPSEYFILFQNENYLNFYSLSSVVANCGASIAENCTYFESTGTEVGMVKTRFQKQTLGV